MPKREYKLFLEDILSSIHKISNYVSTLSFEEFFMLHLDPAVRRWEKNGII